MNNSNIFSFQSRQSLGKIKSFLNGLLDDVSVEEALHEKNTLIDVRTAHEFEKGSIPNAFNYPLFDNLERSEIGIIYRKIGKNAAFEKGLSFFAPKIQKFLSSLTDLKTKSLIVFCARGGMRSASVVRLLQHQGFEALSIKDIFEKRIDPRGHEYFWIKGEMIDNDSSIDYDGKAVSNGYVSITPIHYNITNETFLNDLRLQFLDG